MTVFFSRYQIIAKELVKHSEKNVVKSDRFPRQ